jgi:hypothetical protein
MAKPEANRDGEFVDAVEVLRRWREKERGDMVTGSEG